VEVTAAGEGGGKPGASRAPASGRGASQLTETNLLVVSPLTAMFPAQSRHHF